MGEMQVVLERFQTARPAGNPARGLEFWRRVALPTLAAMARKKLKKMKIKKMEKRI